jgi:hypothetical protein
VTPLVVGRPVARLRPPSVVNWSSPVDEPSGPSIASPASPRSRSQKATARAYVKVPSLDADGSTEVAVGTNVAASPSVVSAGGDVRAGRLPHEASVMATTTDEETRAALVDLISWSSHG